MFSWVAIDRFAEKERAKSAAFRKQSAGKVLRSDAKQLTDDELLAKLRSFGIELDRPSLERLCREALSAEEIATPLVDQRTFHGRQAEMESDWIWVCLTALWQRWFPDQPCFELLDDKMQAGYDLLGPGGATAACRIWLEAWRDVLGLFDKGGLPSIHAFDERFGGSQSLFNWIQDLEDELWNAGLEDPQFLTARIAVCEEGLRRFPAEDDLMTENRRRAVGESYFELGETNKAEALYRDWLQADPRWGWGWIGWSDGYGFTRTKLQDWQRAEQILCEKGLPSSKSGIAAICSSGWPMSAKSRDAKVRRPNSARRRNEVSPQPRSPDKRSGAMSRARAGAERSSRSAAVLDTCRPRLRVSHSHPSIPHGSIRPTQA